MKISWNTLTLVLHGYVILSLVELKFCMKNPECFHGELHGELHGEPVRGTSRGACQGLECVDFCRVECYFCTWSLLMNWYCPGVVLVAVECCRIGILYVECSGSCRIL